MSTTLTCRSTARFFCIALITAGGCTYTGGQMAYMTGLVKGPLIKAESNLTDGKLLVFVDDVHDRIDWPPAKKFLFEEVSQSLLRRKVVSKIIPYETLNTLRSTMPDFRKRGCREIGEKADADQVLWIEVHDFLADENFTEANDAAIWIVTIKVLNVKETKSRSRVRLWPRSPEGQIVSASLSASEIQILSGRDAVAKELARKLADQIVRFFWDHYEEDE